MIGRVKAPFHFPQPRINAGSFLVLILLIIVTQTVDQRCPVELLMMKETSISVLFNAIATRHTDY